MTDKEYQKKAKNELVGYFIDCIDEITPINWKRVKYLLSACCRAGKTRVFAKALREVVLLRPNFAVVATTIGSMPEQLLSDLREIYNEIGATEMNVITKETALSQGQLNHGDILVLGWPEFNKKNNKFIQYDERWNNLLTICERTKNNGTILAQVIDEAHLSAQTDRAMQRIDENIKPHIILEVTATVDQSKMSGYESTTIMPYRKVAKEGLVKNAFIINPDVKNNLDKKIVVNSDESILMAAIHQRRVIEAEFKKTGIDQVPLLVVICNNGDENKLNWVRSFCCQAEGESAVAVYLSEDKTTSLGQKIAMDDLKNNHSIKIVIAKQALATGWNCPRAEVMALLRSLVPGKSFSVQVISRILSTVDAKHHDNELLDNASIFSNMENLRELIDEAPIFKDIEIKEPYNIYPKAKFKDLQWDIINTYINRDEKKTRLSGAYLMFHEVAKEYGLKDKVNINFMTVRHMVDSPYKVDAGKILDPQNYSDRIDGIEKVRKITTDPYDINIVFNEWCAKMVEGWAIRSGSNTLTSWLYRYCVQELGIVFASDDVQRIVSDDRNRPHFEEVIARTITRYGVIVRECKDPVIVHSGEKIKEITTLNGRRTVIETCNIMPLWNPIKERQYKNGTFLTSQYSKCYYEKTGKMNILEQEFVEKFLEPHKRVLVWIKQPDFKSISFLGILYLDDNDWAYTFYPDFIIMLTSGDILIIDTKSGGNSLESNKACALQEQILIENQYREAHGIKERVYGGIVDFDAVTGEAKIYRESSKEHYYHDHKTHNLNNFESLDELIEEICRESQVIMV